MVWQRFTERSRRVILVAQEEAGRLGHTVTDTEHLLLGILADEQCPGAEILRRVGLDAETIREALALESFSTAQSAEPKLSMVAKRVLELAANEAKRMRHNYIGTEHLLLGLLLEKRGRACEVLSSLGLEVEQGKELAKMLSGDSRDEDAMRRPSLPRPGNREVSPNLEFGTEMEVEVFNILMSAQTFAQSKGKNVGEAEVLLALLAEPQSTLSRFLAEVSPEGEALGEKFRQRLQSTSGDTETS